VFKMYFIRNFFAVAVLGVVFSSLSFAVQQQTAGPVCIKNNTKYRVVFVGNDVYEDFAFIKGRLIKLNRLTGKSFDVYVYPYTSTSAVRIVHLEPEANDTITIEYGGFLHYYKDSTVHVENDGTCTG